MRSALLFLAAVAATSPKSDAPKANDFSFQMYGALRSDPANAKGNLFLSGTSMREALGIAYLGARGETATQMTKTLGLDADPAQSAELAKNEIADFKAAQGSAGLAIANRLWVDRSFTPKSAFSDAARDAYGAPAEGVDFIHQTEPARLQINGWVEQVTRSKIKNLLPAGSLTSETRLVITNAIWFKGDWQNAFSKDATRNDDFLVDGTTGEKVPMMHQTTSFPLAQSDGVKMLEMRYSKSDLAMDVLLPDSNTGLSSLEDKVVGHGIGNWTAGLSTQEVAVAFPKVTFTWGGSIKKPLEQLGMTRAFDREHADFSGIAGPGGALGNLVISDVVHKAFVAIDEKGTEAAAATGVIIANPTAVLSPPKVVPFTADHPFMIVIRDTKKDRVLFVGRVTNPKA